MIVVVIIGIIITALIIHYNYKTQSPSIHKLPSTDLESPEDKIISPSTSGYMELMLELIRKSE
jgi:hypothetical protein